MIVRILAAALFLAAASPALADSPRAETLRYEVPGTVPLLQPSVTAGPVVDVLMTDDRLSPRRVIVKPGETIRWRSFARDASRIVFEREVARSMVCHSLVNFELEGDTLRSAPLQTGDTSSFCRLSAGTYRYRVERNGPSDHPTAGARQLSTRLEGVIVVLPKAESIAAR